MHEFPATEDYRLEKNTEEFGPRPDDGRIVVNKERIRCVHGRSLRNGPHRTSAERNATNDSCDVTHGGLIKSYRGTPS